jgi:predicted alternative tryptophan synthase beta-subunit
VTQQAVVDIEEVLRKRLRELEEREKRYRVLCVNVPAELYDKLTLIAQSNGVDREKLVLDLLKTYVENYYKSS